MPPVINPKRAIAVTPQRDQGSGGDTDWQDLPSTRMVLSLNAPQLIEAKGTRYRQGGTAFLPRDYDLAHGDRLPYRGRNGQGPLRHFTVIGHPRGDQDHAITGHEFWAAYTITSGG